MLSHRIAFLCAALISPAASAEQLQAKVVLIADGDTITVIADDTQRQRVRIAGIDAPEKGQEFAGRSRRHPVGLIAGKDATLFCHKIDRYQRKVCKLVIAHPSTNASIAR